MKAALHSQHYSEPARTDRDELRPHNCSVSKRVVTVSQHYSEPTWTDLDEVRPQLQSQQRVVSQHYSGPTRTDRDELRPQLQRQHHPTELCPTLDTHSVETARSSSRTAGVNWSRCSRVIKYPVCAFSICPSELIRFEYDFEYGTWFQNFSEIVCIIEGNSIDYCFEFENTCLRIFSVFQKHLESGEYWLNLHKLGSNNHFSLRSML